MENGMLWYDRDPSLTLKARIMGATAYFEQKYGGKPNKCLVNAGEFEQVNIDDLAVEPSQYVLPKHLLIGLEVNE